MEQNHLPSPFARAALRAIPAPLLQRMIDIFLGRMRARHPHLFKNLEQLDAAVVLFEVFDIPHRFTLAFGEGGASLTVVVSKDVACDACIKGDLDALLNLFEGRIDGDKLFFSRDIEISGDTEVVVALRNTLDREEINLLDDMTSLLGPFSRPMREVVLLADVVARHVRRRLTNSDCKKAAAS